MSLKPFSVDTIATIRRNAGKMPPEQIAKDCGISLSFLHQVARDQHLDLRLPAERLASASDPDPMDMRSYHAPRRRPAHHTEQVNASFSVPDIAAMDQIAHRFGIRRSQVVSRIFRWACVKGIAEELAKLPAPLPDKTDSTEGEI